MNGGFTFKRCRCPPIASASGNTLAFRKKHGSWYFAAETRTAECRRKQIRRGRFKTQADAQAALTAFSHDQATAAATDDQNKTVSEFLEGWLSRKVSNGLRPTTARGYRYHIDGYITPVIGALQLRDVRPTHIEQVLSFAATPKPVGKTPGPTTVRRIHPTMRSAFATAKRQRLIPYNPAVHVGPIKTASGQDRVVDLDEATVGALLSHRLHQDSQRARWGAAWVNTGPVLTREGGSGIHPEIVTKRFRELTVAAGLRPIRVHDLRHRTRAG